MDKKEEMVREIEYLMKGMSLRLLQRLYRYSTLILKQENS